MAKAAGYDGTSPFSAEADDAAAIIAFAMQAAGSTDSKVFKDKILEVGNAPGEPISAGELAKIFERSGVDAARPVLVYSDGEDPLAATITAYALLKAGHPRVLLLDGGFEAWRGVADVTQEFGGFQSTVGNPFRTDWSRASGNVRHQLQYRLSYNFGDAVTVSWGGNIRSGAPYTALISGGL